MQLRQLFEIDPVNLNTEGRLANVADSFVGAFGVMPEAFFATPGHANALRFFFDAWIRRLPDPVPVTWICGPAGTGKTTLLNSLAFGLDCEWPATQTSLSQQFHYLREQPPHLLMLSAGLAKPRFGVEPLAISLLRAFNGEQGYSVNTIEIAALERWLQERDMLEHFARSFHARTHTGWSIARETAQVLKEDLVNAIAASLTCSREQAEKNYELAIAQPQDAATYLQQWLIATAQADGPHQRVLVLIDDVDQLFDGDQKHMRDALALLSRFASDSFGRIACAVSSRSALASVLSDWGDWVPAGVHSVALGPKDALDVLYSRWLRPSSFANVALAALAPELTHPFSEPVLAWLARILAAQPNIHALTLLAEVLKSNAERPAVELLGPSALMGTLAAELPIGTAKLLQAAFEDMPAAQAAILSALALAPLGGLATLSEAELASLSQPRLGERVIPSQALHALEKAGWLRRLEGGVALSLPESQVRQSVGEQLSLSLRERMRLLAEVLFEKVLGGKTAIEYRNRRHYGFNRLCDSHAHGSAEHELTLMLLTPLAPEFIEFDEFYAVLRSAEGGGQALLKLGAIPELNEKLAAYARAKSAGSSIQSLSITAIETELVRVLEHSFETAEVFVAGKRMIMTAIEPGQIVDAAMVSLIEAVHPHVSDLSHQQSEALAMIRVVLGGRELPLGENAAALANIDLYFEQHMGQIYSLGDVVQRYRRRPYGWPDLEIVLLVARLVRQNDLSARIDGHSARPAEAAEAFTNAALWSRVELLRAPEGVSDDMLIAARHARDLFGRPFSLDSPVLLANALRFEVDAWRNELTIMADPNSAIDAHDAREALSELKRLSLMRDGDEFLSEFIEQVDVLRDIGADLAGLRSARAQHGPAFDRLRGVLSEIRLNMAAIRRNPAAQVALERLLAIQTQPARSETAAEIDMHCETLMARNNQLIFEARELALARIEQAKEQVLQQLEQLDASDAMREKSLSGLQSLRDRVDLENMHASLLGFSEEAASERDAVLDRLNRQITSERPAVGEQQLLLTVVRPGRLGAGLIIEQEADLDVYFEKLRAALVPMLKAGMRVRLE
jgi:hypothetical protein